jgi:hypothetical protein
MVAKARSAMVAWREQVKSGNLVWRVEGAFMAAPNRGLFATYRRKSMNRKKRSERWKKPSFPEL